jgi:hypothetical protein
MGRFLGSGSWVVVADGPGGGVAPTALPHEVQNLVPSPTALPQCPQKVIGIPRLIPRLIGATG